MAWATGLALALKSAGPAPPSAGEAFGASLGALARCAALLTGGGCPLAAGGINMGAAVCAVIAPSAVADCTAGAGACGLGAGACGGCTPVWFWGTGSNASSPLSGAGAGALAAPSNCALSPWANFGCCDGGRGVAAAFAGAGGADSRARRAPRRLRRSGLSQPRRSWRESGSKQAEPIEAAGLGLGRPQVRFPADPQAPAHRWCPRCRVLGFRTLDFLLARPRPDGRRSWARWHWRGRGPARAPAAAGPNRPWRRRRCTCIPPSRARVGATALSGQQGSGQSSYHEISFKNIYLRRRGSRGCAVS